MFGVAPLPHPEFTKYYEPLGVIPRLLLVELPPAPNVKLRGGVIVEYFVEKLLKFE